MGFKLFDDDPVYTPLLTPFSASPYYDFLDEFLLGAKLDTYFDYSDECIGAIVYTLDDKTYFSNNKTLTKG